jgi:hypothetical protein
MSVQPRDMRRLLVAGKVLATIVHKGIENGDYGDDPKDLISACAAFGFRPDPDDKPSTYERVSAWLRTKLQKT